MFKRQHIHFVGIGGSGMSGIAEVLITMGHQVTGSDLKESATVKRLRKLGGTIHIGHSEGNITGCDVVVKSTAVPMSNPEIVAAEASKIPVIPRAEMLGELMRMKYGLAVAGTHGKTTTTSMLAKCMHAGGFDPTIVIGGKLDSMGSSARLGEGEFMVAEADESDGSFMLLDPTVAVITSIDPEHMEHWGSMDALVDGFADFANKVPFFGFAALCLDHPTVQDLLPRVRRRVLTYGLNPQAEVRGSGLSNDGLRTSFTVHRGEEELGEITLGMPGRHNVANALAAIAVSLDLGVPFATLQTALDGFSGVDRRYSVRAQVGGVTIIDDYGHHPAEIDVTLEATAQAFPGRRIHAVFQPHRFSRVRDLMDEFSRAFNAASHVVVCPIYRAGEAPIEGIDRHRMASALTHHGHRSVHTVDDLDAAVDHLADVVKPGDVVITLGAGDVNSCCGALAERLGGEPRDA